MIDHKVVIKLKLLLEAKNFISIKIILKTAVKVLKKSMIYYQKDWEFQVLKLNKKSHVRINKVLIKIYKDSNLKWLK